MALARTFELEVSLPAVKTFEDANECVASFFVRFRLALDDARLMKYHDDNPLYAAIVAAEDAIRDEIEALYIGEEWSHLNEMERASARHAELTGDFHNREEK